MGRGRAHTRWVACCRVRAEPARTLERPSHGGCLRRAARLCYHPRAGRLSDGARCHSHRCAHSCRRCCCRRCCRCCCCCRCHCGRDNPRCGVVCPGSRSARRRDTSTTGVVVEGRNLPPVQRCAERGRAETKPGEGEPTARESYREQPVIRVVWPLRLWLCPGRNSQGYIVAHTPNRALERWYFALTGTPHSRFC